MFTRTHTVDKAIAPLLKAEKDLALVDSERTDQIEKNENKISFLIQDNEAAVAERQRANRIAAALREITDPYEPVDLSGQTGTQLPKDGD